VKIGELARKAGVSAQALRYYERRRLLRKPRRTSSGYRIYSDTDLETVLLIKQLQRFRFTLKEIRRVLQLYLLPLDEGPSPRFTKGSHRCLDEVAEIGDRKLKSLDEEIRALVSVREELASTLGALRSPRR
jgi:DNA-binding transcriptional MerR regulator